MNRADLIAAMEITAAPRLIPVTVPTWGTVYVKPPTVEEVDSNVEANAAARATGVAALPGLIQAAALAVAAAEASPDDAALARASAVAAARVTVASGKAGLARAAARMIRDEHGKHVFDPANEDDLVLLAMQPYAMMQTILGAADAPAAADSGNLDSAASSSTISP